MSGNAGVQAPRHGPNGEVLLKSDRDAIRADFRRRLGEGRTGMVEGAALCCWDGAELALEAAELRATKAEAVVRFLQARGVGELRRELEIWKQRALAAEAWAACPAKE